MSFQLYSRSQARTYKKNKKQKSLYIELDYYEEEIDDDRKIHLRLLFFISSCMTSFMSKQRERERRAF